MLRKVGEHIGKRMDPDHLVGVVYKQSWRGRCRWRWFAYYCPPGISPPTTIGDARRRGLKFACTSPINGYSTYEEAKEAAINLLNVVGE